MKKEEIFEQTIMKNIKRKSVFVDKVQFVNNKPLFSWIDINVTELCNRKCIFCPRADNSIYPNQNLHLSKKLSKKIHNELLKLNYEGSIVISGYGEPLLHPEIDKIVKILGNNTHLELVTNGDKLTQELLVKLFKNGLDVIVISMYDGPHQIEQFTELFEKANIDKSQYILRDRWYSIEEDYGVKLTNRAGLVQKGNQEKIVIENNPCHYPFYSMMIDWNGDIMLCVQDWNKKVKMGNASNEKLIDIWLSNNFTKYRNVLKKGKRCLSPCDKCNTNGTLHGSNHLEAWSK